MNSNNQFQMVERTSETQGLSNFFSRVYNYMGGGLALSGVMAYLTTKEPLFSLFYSTNAMGQHTLSLLGILAIIAPLVLLFMMHSAANQMQSFKLQAFFWLFSALMGIGMSNIFFLYSMDSIFQVFLITAGTFFAMSIYGHTTKKSLAAWGSFLFMGLIGVILAALVNFFLKSSALGFGLSVITVFIFVGLTAYDTQRLKSIYNESDMYGAKESKAIMGAVALYLDFINLFQALLQILGDRR